MARPTLVPRRAAQYGHQRSTAVKAGPAAAGEIPGQGRSRSGWGCGASWNRTSDLTLIRACACRGVRPDQHLNAEVSSLPVPRRSRESRSVALFGNGTTSPAGHSGCTAQRPQSSSRRDVLEEHARRPAGRRPARPRAGRDRRPRDRSARRGTPTSPRTRSPPPAAPSASRAAARPRRSPRPAAAPRWRWDRLGLVDHGRRRYRSRSATPPPTPSAPSNE